MITKPKIMKHIANGNWLSPLNANGDMLFSRRGTVSPWEFILVLNTFFQGQILFNDPIINPTSMANVRLLYVLNIQFKTFENALIPNNAQSDNIKKLLSASFTSSTLRLIRPLKRLSTVIIAV